MMRPIFFLLAISRFLFSLTSIEPSLEQIVRLDRLRKEETATGSDLFLLAQLYQAEKWYERAISCYLERLKKPGAHEEIWFSKYMLAECFESLNQWDEALYWYLESYEEDPNQANPLLKISRHYRFLGQNDLAYIFAKFGSTIPLSNERSAFKREPIQSYFFDEELSIVAYYTPFKEDGYVAVNNLLLKRGVPTSIRDQAYRNLLFYVEPLKEASYLPIRIELPFVTEGIRYNPMNPSILKTSDGYELICRTVNYIQEGARDFHTYDPEGIYRTRNFLIEYDLNFKLLSQKEIIDETSRIKLGNSIVQGFEDCRIFAFNQQLWFSCTTTDTNPTGSFQISLGHLNEDALSDFIGVDRLVPLIGPDPYRCEKNWLPFVFENKFSMIYQYDPFTIYSPDLATGGCESIYSYSPEHNFSGFRGSAGPIVFDDGYLTLVHEVTFLSDYKRAYTHRFVFFDSDWKPVSVSKPFVFQHIGVEYCCSMSWDHSGTRVLLPIGIEDREAFLCILDQQRIQSMLIRLP